MKIYCYRNKKNQEVKRINKPMNRIYQIVKGYELMGIYDSKKLTKCK